MGDGVRRAARHIHDTYACQRHERGNCPCSEVIAEIEEVITNIKPTGAAVMLEIETLDKTTQRIADGLYQAIQLLNGGAGLLACVGSWGDTLPSVEIAEMIEEWVILERERRRVPTKEEIERKLEALEAKEADRE